MLHVMEPGLYSLLVDLGRPRTRSLGVPIGGEADRTALALGNALVGNAPNAVGLEVTLAGPTLQAEMDVGAVVFGAPFDVQVGGQDLRPGAAFYLRAGEVLCINGTAKGMRGYLCVRGGFESPTILGSRSAFTPIAVNEVLSCPTGRLPVCFLRPGLTATFDSGTLRVLEGPQADWFAGDQFYGQGFSITPRSNRMGLRLDGAPLTVPDRELISEPVCPGAVQVTRDGRCIVLGVDGQTIGGYPKIAQVISADLDKLAQARPGESVRFIRVGQEKAEGSYREQRDELRRWLLRVQVAQFG